MLKRLNIVWHPENTAFLGPMSRNGKYTNNYYSKVNKRINRDFHLPI
jgi:hypothetical protein